MSKNLVVIILVSILAIITSYKYVFTNEGDLKYRNVDGSLLDWGAPLQLCALKVDGVLVATYAPILGTAQYGKNLAFRLSHAIWTNFKLAFLYALWPFLIFGVLGGIIIGYDRVPIMISYRENNRQIYRLFQIAIAWIIETFHSIPILLILLVSVILANKIIEDDYQRMLVVMISIGVLSTPKLALLIRDRISLLEQEEFIEAARASGLKDSIIIFKHILFYDMRKMLLTQVVYIIIQSVMLETVISFLGYGIRSANYESLGKMISEFKNILPTDNGGEIMALAPLALLVAVSLAGNRVAKGIEE